MTALNPYQIPHPWNPHYAPRTDPPIPTGLAGFDAITGGLHGITVIAARSYNHRSHFALAATLGAMGCNPRLGAVICCATNPDHEIVTTLAALLSGVARGSVAKGTLNSAEQDRLKRARTELENGRGRRLKFLEPLTNRPYKYTDVRFPITQILDAREQLFRSGEIDRCMVEIDGLDRITVPIPADLDMADSDGQETQAAIKIEKGRRQFEFAVDLWQRMRCGLPQDPVLVVAGTDGDRQSCPTPNDICVQIGAEVYAVGLLHPPLADRDGHGEASRVDLDVYLGLSEKSQCVPLRYDPETCPFWEAATNVGVVRR